MENGSLQRIRQDQMAYLEVKDGKGAVLYATIDDDMLETAQRYSWRAHRAARSLTVYARGQVEGRGVLLHRFILGEQAGPCVDHINGDGLDCQRANLRSVTQGENVRFGVARRAFDQYENEL